MSVLFLFSVYLAKPASPVHILKPTVHLCGILPTTFPPHYMHLHPQAIPREHHDTGTPEDDQRHPAQHGRQQYNGDSSPAYSQPEEYSGTSISGSEWSLSSTPTGQGGIWMNHDTSGLEDSVATLVSHEEGYEKKGTGGSIVALRKGSSPLQDLPEGVLTLVNLQDPATHIMQNYFSISSRTYQRMICSL